MFASYLGMASLLKTCRRVVNQEDHLWKFLHECLKRQYPYAEVLCVEVSLFIKIQDQTFD